MHSLATFGEGGFSDQNLTSLICVESSCSLFSEGSTRLTASARASGEDVKSLCPWTPQSKARHFCGLQEHSEVPYPARAYLQRAVR